MAAAAGLQEMLIQSYSGTVKLFPAVPESWKNAGFYKLRTEGAFLVSALKQNGKVARVEISSEKGGRLKLQNPFGTNDFEVSLSGCKQIPGSNKILEFECQPNAKIELSKK